MSAKKLGEKYGRRLELVQDAEDYFVVNQLDEYGLITHSWGSGPTAKEALENTEAILADVFGPSDETSLAHQAYVAAARVFPSNVLKQVLLERGDWNIEVGR